MSGMVVLLLCSRCLRKNESGAGVPAGKEEITVVTAIDALTRAPHLNEDGSGYFQDGDKIALTVTGGGKAVLKEYTIGGAALYWEDLGLPSGTTEASFAGCYPALPGRPGPVFLRPLDRRGQGPVAGSGYEGLQERRHEGESGVQARYAQAGDQLRFGRHLYAGAARSGEDHLHGEVLLRGEHGCRDVPRPPTRRLHLAAGKAAPLSLSGAADPRKR